MRILALAFAALLLQSGASSIYRTGWIDFNKNGAKDPYEDPAVAVDQRIDNLLAQMTLDEKSCQLATLYGYSRVLPDELPTGAPV